MTIIVAILVALNVLLMLALAVSVYGVHCARCRLDAISRWDLSDPIRAELKKMGCERCGHIPDTGKKEGE